MSEFIDLDQPGTSSSIEAINMSITGANHPQRQYALNNNDGECVPLRHANDADQSSPVTETDEEIVQDLTLLPHKYDYYLMPNKAQVLFYLSDASLLRIRRAGTELQVTDSIDFPLFDIWIESNCTKSTLVLESYGRTVLLITENSYASRFSKRRSEPLVTVVSDWNGDLFGYFIPGDPFLIEDSDKRTIAKVIATDSAYGRSTVWICVFESSGREIARLEDLSTIYFAKDAGGFQLKLLTLAAFARLAASESLQSHSCACCCCCCSSLFSIFFR